MQSALSFLMDPLNAVLTWLHDTLGVSWAVSIILLTIFVRVLLIPLTVKQYTSMRAMQKLQPKIKELQAQHKDDKQKLNEEMMKFYRENKVNPFGSCLPLLIQMPIFMALYFMLQTKEFPTDYAFLWISNIKDPSTILVVLYMASQLLSSRLLTTSVDKSQQMMMYMMPLVFGVIFLFTQFPAGVLIYWVTTNLWTIGQQLVVMRIMQAREDSAAATMVTAGTAPDLAENTGGKSAGKPKPKKKRR
ncbi:MAG: YidC/Oxa1 family membrane protein insertase [Thermoleophilia bacterium]